MPWERLLQEEVLVFLVPITAILVGGAIVITKLIIRHRERIAMIEHGMDPDRRAVASTDESAARGHAGASGQD
jgi:hypothetical protein